MQRLLKSLFSVKPALEKKKDEGECLGVGEEAETAADV